MSAAALKLPGCDCCAPLGVCDCGLLNPAAAIGLRLNVPDVMPKDISFPERFDPFYMTRNSGAAGYYTDQKHTAFVSIGGYSGCQYQLEFTFDARIDRGSYANEAEGRPMWWCIDEMYTEVPFKQWPLFSILMYNGLNRCSAVDWWGYNARILKATGEAMPLAFTDFLEKDGTQIVIRWPSNADWAATPFGPTGPIEIALGRSYFRYSAGCFVEIKDIQCVNERVRPW